MSDSSNLEVLIIDPCFGDLGVANNLIPLSVGLLGSHLKQNIPEINVTVLKKSTEILPFLDKKKPDVLGICNYLWNANLANRLSRYAREKNPKTFYHARNLIQKKKSRWRPLGRPISKMVVKTPFWPFFQVPKNRHFSNCGFGGAWSVPKISPIKLMYL